MFKRLKKLLATAIIFTFLAAIFAGCTASQKPLQTQPNSSQGNTTTIPNTGAGTGGQSLSTIQKPTTASGIGMASTISNQLQATNGIKRAAVLIDGNTAIVGLKFTDGTGKVATTSLQGASTTTQVPGTNAVTTPGNVGITSSRVPGLAGTQVQVNPTTPNVINQSNVPANEPNKVSNDIKTLIANRVKAMDSNISKVLVTTDIVMVDRMQRLSDTLNKDITDISNKIQAGGGAR